VSRESRRLLTRAKAIRADILRSTTEAGSGHPSSSLSAVDVVTALYFGGFMRYDPKNPGGPTATGSSSPRGTPRRPVLYAALAEAGYFPRSSC
jgi:transketolase